MSEIDEKKNKIEDLDERLEELENKIQNIEDILDIQDDEEDDTLTRSGAIIYHNGRVQRVGRNPALYRFSF